MSLLRRPRKASAESMEESVPEVPSKRQRPVLAHHGAGTCTVADPAVGGVAPEAVAKAEASGPLPSNPTGTGGAKRRKAPAASTAVTASAPKVAAAAGVPKDSEADGTAAGASADGGPVRRVKRGSSTSDNGSAQEAAETGGGSTGSSAGAAQQGSAPASATQPTTQRARLLGLDVEEFKVFTKWEWRVNDGSVCCLVGPNSSGKSSVLDALQFVLQRKGGSGGRRRNDRDVFKRGASTSSLRPALVTAFFEQAGPAAGGGDSPGDSADQAADQGGADEGAAAGGCKWAIRREVCMTEDGDIQSNYWIGEPENLEPVPMERYMSWIDSTLGWLEGGSHEVWMHQFSLIEGQSAANLLRAVPDTLQRTLASESTAAPLLKRRAGAPGPNPGGSAPRTSSAPAPRGRLLPGGPHGARRAAAEAWLARRIDEIYRELTREPLDEDMSEWGEGGQACLRRGEDGSFSLLVSERRGAAACGYGTHLEQLSDGDKDLCAIAIALTLPGLLSGMQDKLPPFVALDEPDSRLDKRHAKALHRFLAGPLGPRQSLVLSLNNHDGFTDAVEVGS